MGSTLSSQSHESSSDPYDADVDIPSASHVSSSGGGGATTTLSVSTKLLEQEPEILLCRASASPLSPQPSNAGTPRVPMGHTTATIRVWDPCHVLIPPQSPVLANSSNGNGSIEVVLISHGESAAALRPDLIGGSSPAAGLTARGERQARALAVFLKSRGVRFGAVYSSPLDRARATASLVCRELDFPDVQIQTSESLTEMSNGQWENQPKSEIYTPEIQTLIDKTQPDFSPPNGESLRQIQFRVIEFLNKTVIKLPEKLNSEQIEPRNLSLSRQSSMNSVFLDRDGPNPGSHWFNRSNLQRKKSGKSRLQFVTTGDNTEMDDDFSGNLASSSLTVGIFTHSTLVKCIISGVLDCSATVSQRICIEDSSVSVLEHSVRTGWQIKKINDTSHLRLL